jgi:ribosomal protein S12 methylthiotransferase accessory factor
VDGAIDMTALYDAIDDLTGIANAVRTIFLDPGSPDVFVATARMSDTTPYFGVRGDAFNSGAGFSQRQAWDAAVGEAVERYCLSAVQPDRITLASWSSLDESAGAIHPIEVIVHDEPASSHPDGDARSFEEVLVGWLPGHSLVDGRDRLVPACTVHIPYRRTHPDEKLIAPAISTGSAAGTTLEDAVLSGLYESIERDAFSIMWLNRWPAPRLLIDEDELSSLFNDRFRRPNLDYHLFVVELETGAPTVICVILDANFDPPLSCIGGAARIDVRDAAVKAMIECVQGWHWARDHRLKKGPVPLPADFASIRTFESRVQLYACADMRPALAFLLEAEETVRISDCPRRLRSASEAIQDLASCVHAAGSDVILIPLTTAEVEELGWHAVKVFCPALQQLEGDHRHRPIRTPRWREVPVRQGWSTVPLDVTQINPYPHPYA